MHHLPKYQTIRQTWIRFVDPNSQESSNCRQNVLRNLATVLIERRGYHLAKNKCVKVVVSD